MSLSFLARPIGSAYAVLTVLILLLQATSSVQSAEIRCDANHIGHNAASTQCPVHQYCTPRGVCKTLVRKSIMATRGRHVRPIPNTSHKSLKHGCVVDPAVAIQSRDMSVHDTEQTSEPLINTHQIFASFGKPLPAPQHEAPGDFRVAGDSGVPAMHAALMPNGKVVFLDKIENYTQLKLDDGEFAYSSEWNPVSGEVAPLAYKVEPMPLFSFFSTTDHIDQCLLLRGLVPCFGQPSVCLRERTFAARGGLYIRRFRRDPVSYPQFFIARRQH